MNQYPIPTVRIILQDKEGKILLLKRAKGKIAGGYWCLPGGKVDYNKTLEKAGTDELMEETGLDISNLKFLFFTEDLPQEKEKEHYIGFYFSATFNGSITLNEESSDFAWVDTINLKDKDIAFNHDKAIEKFLTGKF